MSTTLRPRPLRWNAPAASGAPPVIQSAPASCGCCIVIACPHCGDVHKHSRGDGHRVAHCLVQTAASREGYVIRERVP
jgi:hypothetical protein